MARKPVQIEQRPGMLAGLILAGGRSSRFGADKAAAALGGETLLARAAQALQGRCERIAVSAPPGSAADILAKELGLAVIADRPGDGVGPLAGVRAGLQWAASLGADRLAVRPVDTPFLPEDLFDRLAAALGRSPAAYCVTAEGPEALCSLWSPAALEPLTQALAGGHHPAAHSFLDAIGAAVWRAPDPAAFANVNTPQEMAAARRR
jgi:molybdopterin-guanine dinucleotide biosynthesis protein A